MKKPGLGSPRGSWDRSWHHVGSQGCPRHEKDAKRAFAFPSSGAKLGAFWNHFSMIFWCNFLFVFPTLKNRTFLEKSSQILPEILPKMLSKSIGTSMQKQPSKICTKNVKNDILYIIAISHKPMFYRGKTYIREDYPKRNTCIRHYRKTKKKSLKKTLNFGFKINTKSESNLYTQKIGENNYFSSKMAPKRDPFWEPSWFPSRHKNTSFFLLIFNGFRHIWRGAGGGRFFRKFMRCAHSGCP